MVINFNPQQLEAINHINGACAVIAGAGSGKSTILVNRIKNLVENNIKQKDILAISFTSNTVSDLKKKLEKLGLNEVNVGTFHSICQRILSTYNRNVSNLVKEWQIEKCFKNIDSKANIKDIQSFISYQKNYLRLENDEFVSKNSGYSEIQLRKFYTEYEKMKKSNNIYDFDDWMIECYNLLKKNKNISYDYVLIDEHQDSNMVQNLILKELCKTGNIFAVFDFRQAIYTFRGGNPEYCMNFHNDWENAKVINLDTNYRSNNNIVNMANDFIKKYYGDYKHFSDSIANNKNNGQININTYMSTELEAKEIVNTIDNLLKNGENPQEIAVLYRLNSHSGNVENELKSRDIKYDISNDSSFFKRKEISLLISYLRLINNPHDDGAFEKIFNARMYPLTFFQSQLLEKIRLNSGKNNLSMYESFISMKFDKTWQTQNMNIFKDGITRLRLQKDKNISIETLIDNILKTFNIKNYLKEKYNDEEDMNERLNSLNVFKTFIKSNDVTNFLSYIEKAENTKKTSDGIKLMTIHASKGLEFKHVFVISVEDGKFPHKKSDIDDEARLFYVATTRAKECLYISQIGIGNKFVTEYFGEDLTKHKSVV